MSLVLAKSCGDIPDLPVRQGGLMPLGCNSQPAVWAKLTRKPFPKLKQRTFATTLPGNSPIAGNQLTVLALTFRRRQRIGCNLMHARALMHGAPHQGREDRCRRTVLVGPPCVRDIGDPGTNLHAARQIYRRRRFDEMDPSRAAQSEPAKPIIVHVPAQRFVERPHLAPEICRHDPARRGRKIIDPDAARSSASTSS